jgi:hypothetical protein
VRTMAVPGVRRPARDRDLLWGASHYDGPGSLAES